MKHIIWDLDGTLYPYDDAFIDRCNATAAATVIEDFGLTLTFEKAKALVHESYHVRQDWTALLVERHGIDADALHTAYHRRMDHTAIKPYDDLSRYFTALGEASHCILTHANTDWSNRVVDHTGLRAHFPAQRIIALEHYKVLKHVGQEGFCMALDRLGEPSPQETMFVDDSAANMPIAKKLGLITVFITAGREIPATYKQSIDYSARDSCDFMRKNLLSP